MRAIFTLNMEDVRGGGVDVWVLANTVYGAGVIPPVSSLYTTDHQGTIRLLTEPEKVGVRRGVKVGGGVLG